MGSVLPSLIAPASEPKGANVGATGGLGAGTNVTYDQEHTLYACQEDDDEDDEDDGGFDNLPIQDFIMSIAPTLPYSIKLRERRQAELNDRIVQWVRMQQSDVAEMQGVLKCLATSKCVKTNVPTRTEYAVVNYIFVWEFGHFQSKRSLGQRKKLWPDVRNFGQRTKLWASGRSFGRVDEAVASSSSSSQPSEY
ncbi:hypothetical protein K440DRAFT_663672 [Wilcoxina mikolae CBS 423.85]|nr:hypothetical protein K440DRAFT_663672 [Wilcoxina mikolae CBS 423.85]